MERCPICNSPISRTWKSTTPRWWSGEFQCTGSCGNRFRASGVVREGNEILIHFHPSCEDCGMDSVIPLHDPEMECITHPPNRWECTRCGSIMHHVCEEIIVGKIRTLKGRTDDIDIRDMEWGFNAAACCWA